MDDKEHVSGQEEEGKIEVVFEEAWDGKEVESIDFTEEDSSEIYEDEDELDRIPLEQEPTLQEAVEELRQEKEREKSSHGTDFKQPAAKGPEAAQKQEYGLGLTAMILGILSILGFCLPPIGLVLATVAVILGIVATARKNGKKMGGSGIIMGVIVLLSYLVTFIFFDGVFGFVSRNQDRLTDTAWRRTTDGSVLYLYNDGTFIDVEQEGVFTDNFYSGTYDILAYEDTGLAFGGLENAYNTNYVYDVYLYVNTYVSHGEEREDIAGTIRYLYLFERSYETGDAVDVCAHDSVQYGSVYPVKETKMAYPTIGNQYITGMEDDVSDTELTEEPEADRTETATEEGTEASSSEGETVAPSPEGEASATEPELTVSEEPDTETTAPGSTAAEGGGIDAPWGGISDWIQDSKEDLDNFSSSVSEEIEKSSESISSAMEESSSAMEDASSAFEDFEQNVDTDSIWKFFQRIFQWIQDLFS